ncbi:MULTISPECIES: LytR/AlgR family response regulator transcription factor [Chryseobacterium]|uniref:LytTR family DNA-binding domain-containing protein n=1 Tax=Chryseobacterium indicum TaxID=2766954 RepID=A0ABS9CA84_9FLAO|nr:MULTISPECIES: LytTR family DNA-binding domain-containing protein [unclassified Chryseobacterium]MCF2221485.1 LytTR family DNA-binding domain-containing protein [Chryseobacterium sp. PS-8]
MITAIALDDELPSLEIIEAFCANIEEIDLKKTFLKTSEARYFLENNPVDLLFLDINMPAASGIDFYKTLPQETLVIFTTAYKEYAVESYEIGAFDYLLKPFSFQRFKMAVDRAAEQKKLLSAHDEGFIYFRVDYGLVKVVFSEILYIEGQDNYVKFYFENQKSLLVRITIKELLEKLPEQHFCRIHRSSIVSLAKITSFRHKTVYIKDIALPVGNTYEEDFLKKI